MLEYLKIVDEKLKQTTEDDASILVYYEPTEEELGSISNTYSIDNYDIRSCLDNDEIPRIEVNKDYYLLILKRPKSVSPSESTIFKINTVGIFIVKNKMIFLMRENLHILDNRSLGVNTLTDVLLRFIYSTISHFIGHLKIINMITESFEKNLTDNIDNKTSIYMYNLKKSLVYYIAGINENAIFLDKLKNIAKKLDFSDDNIDLITDIIIENEQAKKLSIIFSSIIDVMINAKEVVTNNKLNKTMKNLTLITAVFVPLSFIAGVFGMSEWTVFTGGESNMVISYTAFLIISVIVAVVMYFVFNWKDGYKW